MNNEELKKKILTIVRGAMLEADELPFIETTDNIADALIAAGIGDVKTEREIGASAAAMAVFEAAKAEYRAVVAEMALKNLAQLCAKGARYYLQSDKAVKERERELYDEWIKQAEKELAEERKDEQS